MPTMPTGKTLVLVTAVVCVGVMGVALGYRVLLPMLVELQKPKEVLTPVVFAPLEGAKAVAVVDAVRSVVPELLSTTLPVSASSQALPLHTATTTETEDVSQRDHMAKTGHMHADVGVRAVTGGYVVKYENSDLCNAAGACPMAVFANTVNGGEDELLLTLTAKRVQVSDQGFGGNPDLLVDYGISGMEAVRLYWDEQGQYPSYQSYPLSATKPIR